MFHEKNFGTVDGCIHKINKAPIISKMGKNFIKYEIVLRRLKYSSKGEKEEFAMVEYLTYEDNQNLESLKAGDEVECTFSIEYRQWARSDGNIRHFQIIKGIGEVKIRAAKDALELVPQQSVDDSDIPF